MIARINKWLPVVILSLVVFATHQTILICYKEVLVPPQSCTYGSAQGQLTFLFIVVLLILFDIRIRGIEKEYLAAWKQNWVVGVFVVLALFSLLWTVYPPGTIYRSLLLVSVTFIASYVGFRFSIRDLIKFIAIYVGVVAAASLLLAAILPDAAIMPNRPYVGLWRGIFWHKTYMGAVMAIGCITYLVILFSPRNQFSIARKIAALAALMVSGTLLILSDSATGLITLTAEIGLMLVVLAWLRWGHKITRRGYQAVGLTSILGIIGLAANLDVIFGVFNRSATLTGRVPLWMHLLNTYVSKRPFWGHGFATFWLQPEMSKTIQSVVKWGYIVKNSDNGYLDILLGLGAAGLILVLSMLVLGFTRTLRHAFVVRDLNSFFPVLMLVHISLINISLSYFVEMESFIWFLLVTILFLSTTLYKRLESRTNNSTTS